MNLHPNRGRQNTPSATWDYTNDYTGSFASREYPSGARDPYREIGLGGITYLFTIAKRWQRLREPSCCSACPPGAQSALEEAESRPPGTRPTAPTHGRRRRERRETRIWQRWARGSGGVRMRPVLDLLRAEPLLSLKVDRDPARLEGCLS